MKIKSQATSKKSSDAQRIAELEAQLLEAEKRADQALNAKGEFMSRISHEIRTPINAIIGMSHIAQSAKEDSKLRECLSAVDGAARQLLCIVNDMLDISDIESHKVNIKRQPFNFEQMMVRLAGEFEPNSERKKQKLYCNIDVGMPTRFKGDEGRISQIIKSLLSNAIKYTPEGGAISLAARQLSRDGNESTIEIAVTDTGIGISKANQNKLFQAFSQIDGSKTRQHGGAGLGLAIVKQLAELMDGEVSVTSEINRGSTFRFTAKLTAISESNKAKAESKQDMHGMNVLIVDSDKGVQRYFCQVMEGFKIHAIPVSTMEDAMHEVELGRKDARPISILFVDSELARNDEIHIAQALLRQYSVYTVVMLPMTRMKDSFIVDTKDAKLRYIAKPLFPSALLRAIYEIKGAPIQVGAAAERKCSFIGYNVLLAEDVEINRRIFEQIMQGTGIEISEAENGALAVEMFEQNPDKYDLILMDIHMPVMDGYEATRLIRHSPEELGKDIPIVAVTANAFPEDIEMSEAAGMNGHITKPIEVDRLLEVMGDMLKPSDKVLGRIKEQEQVAQQLADRALNEANKRLHANRSIDYDEALSRVRGSMRVLKILLTSFHTSNQWEQLKAAIKSEDYGTATRTVHAIKGACANLSLIRLQAKLDELEMQLESHFNIDETVDETGEVFAETLDGIQDALSALSLVT